MQTRLNLTIGETDAAHGIQSVKFDGEFDKAGHEEIRGRLEKCVEDFALKSLIFDFSQLKFINSEGIGYLMELHAHLVKRGRQLVIIGTNEHVKDVFETIGLTAVIKTFPDLNSFLTSNK